MSKCSNLSATASVTRAGTVLPSLGGANNASRGLIFAGLTLGWLSASPAVAQVAAVDWNMQKAEILRHHSALIRIDTSNPPGNETKVVDYLRQVLDKEGIPVQTFALQPARPNLVARLKGNGKKRPILLMAHTDVVGVQREKWPVDPFGAVLKDGYIWGRGARDDKDKLASNLMVMLLAKRMGVPLDRDLIFLAESGEEADPAGVGIRFMVDEHFEEIDAEFALTEGGGATLENGRVTMVNIQTTEKVPRRFRLVARARRGMVRFRGSTIRSRTCLRLSPRRAHGRCRCDSTKPRGPISRNLLPSALPKRRRAIALSWLLRHRLQFSNISPKTSRNITRCCELRSSRRF
jgi:Peptidase family M20/M25/M40